MGLFNKYSKEHLKQKLYAEEFKRVTLSFYRYVILPDANSLRDELYAEWEELGVLGRIYLAYEGINAQLSVPEHNFDTFREKLFARVKFNEIPFKIAVEDDGKSFYKLAVKARKKIVADGLPDDSYDVTNVGKHLDAESFNKAMEEGAIVVDIRNHYESEVGHFQGAICPDSDTFREELPEVRELLKGKENEKILLYCTGGIRCEKTSAYLKHHGFNDVNQLHGGIIEYARQVKAKGLESKFIGKNFVFDERLGERITDDIISRCHQCGEACDSHTNCKNDDCHLLFIQCSSCAEKYSGCCSTKCQEIASLPIEEQRKQRKGKIKHHAHAVYKSRLRPKLGDILFKSDK
jgi:UPF0176 protein